MGNDKVPGVGIHHVALRTNDYERSLRFYQEVLGCTIKLAWQAADGRRLALLDLGCGTCIELIGHDPSGPAAEPGQMHPWMHLTLSTTAPDAVWQRAIEWGCADVLAPKDVTLDSLPARIAFFQGPSGEVIEVFAEG